MKKSTFRIRERVIDLCIGKGLYQKVQPLSYDKENVTEAFAAGGDAILAVRRLKTVTSCGGHRH